MGDRVYTKRTPELDGWMSWMKMRLSASRQDGSAKEPSDSEVLARLVEAGYRSLRDEELRAAKLDAYAAIAADQERAAEIRARFDENARLGLI